MKQFLVRVVLFTKKRQVDEAASNPSGVFTQKRQVHETVPEPDWCCLLRKGRIMKQPLAREVSFT